MSNRYAVVTYTAGITALSDAGLKSALSSQLTAAIITYGPTYPDGPHYNHLNEAGIDFNFHTKYNGYEGRSFHFAFMTAADWNRIYGYSNGLDVDLYVRCPVWSSGSQAYGDFSAVMKAPAAGFPYAANAGRGDVVLILNKMLFIQTSP